MVGLPDGKVITAGCIQAHLAARADADFTCPLTNDMIPWWRTLKATGELNEECPEGIDGQKLQLEMEGDTVILKGKRYFM